MQISPDTLEDFFESLVWKSIIKELESWENAILHELAAPTFDVQSGKMTFSKGDRAVFDEGLRGSLRAIGYMRNLPQMMIESLEQKEQQDESGE